MLKDVSGRRAVAVFLVLCVLVFGRNTAHAHTIDPSTYSHQAVSDSANPTAITPNAAESDDPTIITPVILGIALLVVFSLHVIVVVEHRREEAAAEHDAAADWPS